MASTSSQRVSGLGQTDGVTVPSRPRHETAKAGNVPLFRALLFTSTALPFCFTGDIVESGLIKRVIGECVVAVLAAVAMVIWSRCVCVSRWVVAAGGLFLGVNLLSFVLCRNGLVGAVSVWTLFTLLLLAMLPIYCLVVRDRLADLVRCMSVSAILVALYAVLQAVGLDCVVWSQSPQPQPFSTMGNPNFLAGYCVGTLPFVLLNAVRDRGVWRWVMVISCGLLLVALWLTKCRGGLVGLSASVVCGIWLFRGELVGWWVRHRRVLFVSSAAVLLISACLGWPLLARFGELLEIGSGKENSAAVRLVMWRGAFLMAMEHPLLGVGPGGYTVRFPRYRDPGYERVGVTHNTLHAHCEFLEVLADVGIVGLLAFLGFLASVAWVGVRVFRLATADERLSLGGAMLGAIAILAHSSVEVILRWPPAPFYLYQYFGLILAFDRRPDSWRIRWPFRVLLAALLLAGTWFLTIQPYRSELSLKRGVDRQDRGEHAKAVPWFEEAIRRWPANCRARYYLGYAWFHLQQYDRAEQAYRDLQRYSPDYAQVHWNLAAVYLNQRRWDEAAKEYIEQQQIGGLPKGYRLGTMLQLLGNQASANEKYAAALRQLIAMKPDDVIALNMLGNHCFRAGRFDEAATHYGHIIAIQPKSITALNNLAGVYFVQGNYAQARETCLRIVAWPECGVIPWLNLAKANLLLGDLPNAKAALAEASKRDPGNAELPELRAMLVTPAATPSVGPP